MGYASDEAALVFSIVPKGVLPNGVVASVYFFVFVFVFVYFFGFLTPAPRPRLRLWTLSPGIKRDP